MIENQAYIPSKLSHGIGEAKDTSTNHGSNVVEGWVPPFGFPRGSDGKPIIYGLIFCCCIILWFVVGHNCNQACDWVSLTKQSHRTVGWHKLPRGSFNSPRAVFQGSYNETITKKRNSIWDDSVEDAVIIRWSLYQRWQIFKMLFRLRFWI